MSQILVLEDEVGFQTLLTEFLSGAGHEVTSVSSGAEAAPLLRQRAFDALLLDYRLPGASGIEFLRQVRESGGETPAIIMTAYADVPVVVEAMRLGAVDFLVKPFNLDSILPLLERALGAAPGTALPDLPDRDG